MTRGFFTVVLAGCAANQAVPVVPVSTAASVEVSGTACVGDVEPRIREVIATHHAEQSALVFRIGETPSDATTEVTLQVVRASGEVGLERRYTFAPLDCASAAQLIALTVDRWLSSFPEWAAPPPPPPRPPTRWTEVVLVGALDGMYRPLGADGQVGVLLDSGPREHRFGGSLVVRGSIPQVAGNGRFQHTALLAGASWRHERGPWRMRVEARGGALLVCGIGYAVNECDWLPWWEGALFGGRDVGWGTLGLEVAVTALQHRAVTSDGLVSEDIPFVRIGFAGMFGLTKL